MKSIFRLNFLILLIPIFNSCSNTATQEETISVKKDFKWVEINDEYGIYLPNYLKETKNLNEEASLQYQNPYKETYIIIIDESKEELIASLQELGEYKDDSSVVKNYRDIQLQMMNESMDMKSKSVPVSLKINEFNAEMVEVVGKVEGVAHEIFYLFTFVEGDENVYMIMSWTLAERKEKYKKTFEETAKSFRLLVKKETSIVTEEKENEQTETYFIVVADTNADYYLLRNKMLSLNQNLQIPIDTMGRHYNKAKNLIALPDDDKDEMYAGEYYPRRFPSNNLSLEYLNFYKEQAGDQTIALVAGIYESQQSADSALGIVKQKENKAFALKADVYVGCMH